MVKGGILRPEVPFIAEDLFIRERVEYVQAMFNQWMDSAKAQVDSENIPFKEKIISALT